MLGPALAWPIAAAALVCVCCLGGWQARWLAKRRDLYWNARISEHTSALSHHTWIGCCCGLACALALWAGLSFGVYGAGDGYRLERADLLALASIAASLLCCACCWFGVACGDTETAGRGDDKVIFVVCAALCLGLIPAGGLFSGLYFGLQGDVWVPGNHTGPHSSSGSGSSTHVDGIEVGVIIGGVIGGLLACGFFAMLIAVGTDLSQVGNGFAECFRGIPGLWREVIYPEWALGRRRRQQEDPLEHLLIAGDDLDARHGVPFDDALGDPFERIVPHAAARDRFGTDDSDDSFDTV